MKIKIPLTINNKIEYFDGYTFDNSLEWHKTIGIYSIIFKDNARGKHLVGQTEAKRGFRDRWLGHRQNLRKNKANNRLVQNFYNKYKEYAFIFIILEVCLQKELNEKEVWWIEKLQSMCYQNGFNLKEGGGSKAKFSQESKRKMSESFRGRKLSPETIKKILESKKGYKHSEETRKKLSLSHIGNKNPSFGKIPWNKGKIKIKPPKIKIRSKTIKRWEFKSPSGNTFEFFNLNEFCRKYSLDSGHMAEVYYKERPHHKYWTRIDSLYQKPKYIVIAPDGKSHTFNNITHFCSEQNLNRGNFSSLIHGRLKTCKKWRMI